MSTPRDEILANLWWLWVIAGGVAFVVLSQKPVLARIDRLRPALGCAVFALGGITAGFFGARIGIWPGVLVAVAMLSLATRLADRERESVVPGGAAWSAPPAVGQSRTAQAQTNSAAPPAQTPSAEDVL